MFDVFPRRMPWWLLVAVLAVAASAGLVQRESAYAIDFVVNSTADPGDGVCDAAECTLWEAITAANANGATPDTITFDLGDGVHVIAPEQELPTIIFPLTINGFCDTCDAEPNTAPLWEPINARYSIVLSGEKLNGATGVDTGLRFTTPTVTVRGLVFQHWGGQAIQLGHVNSQAVIAGNFIGTDVAGTSAEGNWRGILLVGGDLFGAGITIGGPNPADRNLISGNTFGIDACQAQANHTRVFGNYIGTDASGTAAIPNEDGITGCSENTFIGMGTAGMGNLIAGNTAHGIYLSSSDNHSIRGNRIGTTASGLEPLGNQVGVRLDNLTDVVVGGSDPANRNIISGNTTSGLTINSSDDILISRNFIGIGLDGATPIPNGEHGIVAENIFDARIDDNIVAGNGAADGTYAGMLFTTVTDTLVRRNSIGIDANGAALGNDGDGIQVNGDSFGLVLGEAGNGNVIGSNSGAGMLLIPSFFGGMEVKGNRIGLNAAGDERPNGAAGISVTSGNFKIGGTGAGEGNIIAHNEGDGVQVTGFTFVEISGNSIFSNGDQPGDIGIDLNGDGVTANDGGDQDFGPNSLQNWPELIAAYSNTVQTLLEVEAESEFPEAVFALELFASDTCTEGKPDGFDFIGRQEFTTDTNGQAHVLLTMPVVTPGRYVTATLTDTSNPATSEFTPSCTQVQPAVIIEETGGGHTVTPSEITIQRGETLLWLNKDPHDHTVVSDLEVEGAPYFSVPISAESVAGFKFDVAGDFPYHDAGNQFTGIVHVIGNNPAPNITSLDPASVFAGSDAIEVEITGTNFGMFTTAAFDRGSGPEALTILSQSATTLRVELTAEQLATPGTFSVEVTNPGPGGGTSSLPFRVIRPPSDLDCNNVVDADDVLAGLQALVGFEDGPLPQDCAIDPITPNADANRDGVADLADILFIRMRIAGLVADIE